MRTPACYAALGAGATALDGAAAAPETLAASAAVASACFWAIGTVLFGRALAARDVRPPSAAAANLFKNLLAVATFLVGWWIVGGAAPDARSAAWLAVSGALGFALGDTCYFAALPRCGAHRTAMVSNLGPPLAAVLAYFLFGESLSARTLVAMAVTLAGVLCVLSDPVGRPVSGPESDDARTRRVGVGFAVAAAVLLATSIVIGRGGFQGVGVMPGSLVRLAGGVVGALVLALGLDLVSRGRSRVERPATPSAEPASNASHFASLARPLRERALFTRLLMPAVFAAVLGLPLYGYALRGAKGGVAAVLFATTPLFTLPITRALGERSGPRTLLGTLLGFAGVVGVIVYGGEA